jgi:protein phosphatase 2C family protein 2/3
VGRDDASFFTTSHVVMSEDHKPYNEDEYRRITEAGGYVSYGRVNGMLALSRALGDFTYKRNGPLVSAEPDVTRVPISPSHESISIFITATDGFWDVMSNAHAANTIVDLLTVLHDDEGLGEFMQDKA